MDLILDVFCARNQLGKSFARNSINIMAPMLIVAVVFLQEGSYFFRFFLMKFLSYFHQLFYLVTKLPAFLPAHMQTLWKNIAGKILFCIVTFNS